MKSDEITGIQVILDFLRSKNPKLGEDLDPDLDLIDSRIIDSLAFVEFIFVLEAASGREISVENVSVDDFRTIRSISRRFLDGAD
jgi:acyl carrier protein